MSVSSLCPADLPPSYTAEALVRMPQFCTGLAASVTELLHTHMELPREVHYVSDLQRWMLSQMALAMHFEHCADAAKEPISPTNLARRVAGTGIASRNTVHAFLMEMRRYNFVVPIDSADGRQRAVRATEMSEMLIRLYFDIHMRALDIVDAGQRYALSSRHPGLLFAAQPRFVNILLERQRWHVPPDSIARFVRSDSGISVLHDLVKGVPPLIPSETDRIEIGEASAIEIAQRYRISRTNVARLLGLAREAGLIGWTHPGNRGSCWISPDLVRAYRLWQAEKLASFSRAFHEACEVMQPDLTLPVSTPETGKVA